MAYGFGNTVNPQLGATNYSGFLQGALSGAQMQAQGGAAIAQGLQSALAGAGVGVRKYLENKETKALFDSSLPNITKTIQENQFLRERLGITDPADPNQLKAGLKGLGEGNLRNGLNVFLKLSAESAESKRQASGFAKALAPGPSPLALAAGSGERFENLPTDAASANQPDPTRAQAFKRATDAGVTNPALLQAILASTSSPQETRRSAAEIAKIQAETTALGTPKTPQPTEAERNAQASVNAQLAAGIITPGQAPAALAAILGGPAAVTQATLQEKERDKQANEAKLSDENKKQAERAELARFKLARAKDVIDKAISLSRLGAGGALQGLPGVRDVSAMVPGFVGIPGVVRGGGGSKTLASYVKTLQSLLSTENIKMLKELSASGATGFGNLSNVEGEKLATDVADLDPTLNEAIFRENAESIREYLTKLLGSTEEAEGRADTSPEPKPKPLSNKAQRFLEAVGSRFSPNSSR
jgi:hypothetical protein